MVRNLLFALVLLLAGASQALALDNEKVAAEIKRIIDSGEPAIGAEANDERIIEVYVFYASDRDYKPIWVRDTGPKAKAREVLEVFKHADEMGLNPANYRVSEIEPRLSVRDPRGLAELELILTRAFLDFGRDLGRGRILPQQAGTENAITAKELGALTLIDGAENADSIAEYVKTLEPQTEAYWDLKRALVTYREIAQKGGWPEIGKGPALKRGMNDARVPVLRKYLVITDDLPESEKGSGETYEDRLIEAVRHFQMRHGLAEDGIVSETTVQAMNVPVIDRIRQIEANLERRRWMEDDPGHYYISVNVADQTLQVVRDKQVIHWAKLVVGKPYSSTPVFGELMRYVVLNPYWNVPPSIATHEYLPKLKRNPGALSRESIRLFAGTAGNAREINPNQVDWSKLTRMPYSLRQDPGPKNALGRAKFMFPNRFNVYIHDTPAKNLFARELRIFSHGCMRVEYPLDLAALLLKDQGWTREKIDAQVASGKQRVINLAKPIPVNVTYLTAWADRNGLVSFRRDVYGRDKRLLAALGDGIAPN
ncbi:MAG: murein L,D-transpeptidase [Hyphomicrobiales bacterium]